MDVRTGFIASVLALAALPGSAGCANLVVKKVPLERRMAGTDRKKGFRYYLNRPYLVVKKPILIAERKVLVEIRGDTVCFLGGERRNQTVRLADLKVSQGEGNFRPVSTAELERIRAALAPADRDESVHRVAEQQIQIETPEASVRVDALPPALPDTTGAEPQGRAAAVTPHGGGTGQQDGTGANTPPSPSQAGASTATDTSNLAGYDVIDPSKLPKDAALTGDMEVIYLPDLDEQYVIKSKNLFAKTAFALTFVNGSELAQVQGEHDATTLTLAILTQIENAIGVASQVAQKEIQQKSSTTTGQHSSGGNANAPERASSPSSQTTAPLVPTGDIYQMTERISIRPGVYRLNKPWEIQHPGCDAPTGLGLLTRIGLPHSSDVFFEKVATLGSCP